MYKSTGRWKKYWSLRKLDWKKEYLDTFDHPHRKLIIDALQGRKFNSLMEIGCASGPNLVNVKRFFPHVQVGGCDISKDAIQLARQAFPNGIFDVCSADQLFFTDKCVDVSLTDMALIYLDPTRIKKALKEIRRVTNKFSIFVEFHHPNPFVRFALRFSRGYHAYDYKKLLKKAGYSEITLHKLTEDEWPGGQPQKTFGYLITAIP